MWEDGTNLAQGIGKSVEVLFSSPPARHYAAKVLLFLSVGYADQSRAHPVRKDAAQAAADALQAARDARARGVRIYCIAVGADADCGLMEAIASKGDGECFKADGDIDAYRDQLRAIFRDLGVRRAAKIID